MLLVRSPVRTWASSPRRSQLALVCPHNDSFHPVYNAPLSPEIITSNWAYFTVATSAPFTVPADAEVTFNGTTWLDLSSGVPDGVELVSIAADRDFSSDTGFWTGQSGWEITGGKAVATATDGALYHASPIVIGERYLISLDIVVTAGTARIVWGGASSPSMDISGHQDIELTITSVVDTNIYLDGIGTFTGSIDNISIQKLTAGTPAGARRWRMRFEASPAHDTLITKTAVLDGVNWPFSVTTHVEDEVEDVIFGGDADVTLTGEDAIW